MWATPYIQALKETVVVKFRPHGNSMQPRIESGQLVHVTRVDALGRDIEVGDIALCKVEGKQWLHLVTAVGSDGRYQISNNKGHMNGWCTPANVFGIVTLIED